jgi:hypothetical protein
MIPKTASARLVTTFSITLLPGPGHRMGLHQLVDSIAANGTGVDGLRDGGGGDA